MKHTLFAPAFLVCLFLPETSLAQKDEIKITPQVRQAFNERYPGAGDVKWEEDSNGYMEASFDMNGEKYRADFQENGEWVETERSIDFDELPDAVRKTVKNEGFDKDDVVEVEWVENNQRGVFYDVELKQGKGKFDLEIATNGKEIGRSE